MSHSPHSKGRATRCGARFRARQCGCEPRLLTWPGVMPARRANLISVRVGARREGGERGAGPCFTVQFTAIPEAVRHRRTDLRA
jgi:hypothetical protein